MREPDGATLARTRDLLLACARLRLDPAAESRIASSIGQGVDWDALDCLGRPHGLAPLLHRHLGRRSDVPKAFRARLWAAHETLARRNAAMARELAEIVQDLGAGGVQVVPYKGPTLAHVAYGDLALREFGDLDLLVRASEALAAAEILARRGYDAEYRLSPALLERLVRSRRHYELPMRDGTRGLLVELHWRTDPDFDIARLDEAAWWSRLDRVVVEDVSMLALPRTELLLSLCLHGTKHAWSSLGWLVDVAELARSGPAIEWEWLIASAGRSGCERHVALGLALASRLLQMPLPPAAQDFVARARIEPLVDSAAGRVLDGSGNLHGLAFVRERLRLRTGARAKARYALEIAFAPGLGEWQRWALPRPLFFLYGFLRPLRLAEKYLLRRTPPAATPRTPPPRPH